VIVVHPSILCFLGAILVLLVRKPVRRYLLPLSGLLSLAAVLALPMGYGWKVEILPGMNLVPLQVDALSSFAGIIFTIVGLCALLFAVKMEGRVPSSAALGYMGAALGVVYAGDLFTVFLFWEILALTSVILIWYGDRPGSKGAGYRYILYHALGGSFLLGGVILQYVSTGSLALGVFSGGTALVFLLLGIGINAAFIPLHIWLPDAYPEATVFGSVFLSIFTTKTAVYLLARTCPGIEVVALMGGIMAVYGAIYALFQDDVRRILSYSIVSQVGFMLAGIGIGGLGVEGGLTHLASDLLFKTLLFMSVGLLVLQTGKNRLSELAGSLRQRPVIGILCGIGALSLAGIPGFCGFVSKGLLLEAVHEAHFDLLGSLLLLVSVITLAYTARLLYYLVLPVTDSPGDRSVPPFLLLGMGGLAAGCLIVGLFPESLLQMFPDWIRYTPFTLSHMTETAAVILAGGMILVVRERLLPSRGALPDIDLLYRALGRRSLHLCQEGIPWLGNRYAHLQSRGISALSWFSMNPVLAGKILGLQVILTPARVILPRKYLKSYEEDLQETQREYPGNTARIWGSGYGMLLVALLFLVYFVYLLIER
jgi:formate hydrogenlyase subunit 3/multisubunit Na+/H+ antiporter MnhD subunit